MRILLSTVPLLALLAAVLGAQAPAPSPAPPALAPGVVHSIVPTAYPGQTYALYLPRAYDPRRPWPLLLLFDPARRGAQATEIYREAAEERGWIVVSSNNGESDVEDAPDPFPAAMRATWDAAHARFSIDPRRIYAAGFSGSARASWHR